MASGYLGSPAGNVIVPITNFTKRTKQINLTVTSSQTGWATDRAVGIFYSDSSSTPIWRLRFNIRGHFTNVSSFNGSVMVSIANVLFNSSFNQSASACFNNFDYGPTVLINNNTSDIYAFGKGSDVASVAISGDIELASEPTTYTTAANMEGNANVSAYIAPAHTTTPGIVDDQARTWNGVKTFAVGTIINETGADSDTRIEGDTDVNLLFCDASTDRVGIGLATPGAKLHVYNGKQLIDSDATAGAEQILIRGVTNANKMLMIGYDTSNNIGRIQSIIQGSGYTPFVINPDGGNVGIGTTATTNAALSISSATTPILADCLTDSAGAYVVSLRTNVGGTLLTKWRVEADGDTISATGSYTSDERVKKNLEPIKYGLKEILQLKPKSFNWVYDSDDETKSFCMSTAQEVQAIMPEMVREDGQAFEIDEKNILVKSVYEKEIMAVMVKAIQEQQELIKSLESRLAVLENA